MKFLKTFIGFFCVITSSCVLAQAQLPQPSAADSTKSARVEPAAVQAVMLKAGETIELNGSLSHPAWGRAIAHSQFYEHSPKNGGPATYKTQFKLLYDAQAVYVGIEAFDPKPELIRAPQTRFDQVFRTMDFLVLYIDAAGKKKSAQFFRVNALGATGDGLHTADNDNEDFAPDYDFKAQAQITAQGFTAVFRVPYSTLRYDPESKLPWRIMVARRTPRSDQNYLSLSVPLPLEAPNFIDNLQLVQGLATPNSQSFLWLRPTITARSVREDGPLATTDTKVKPSLDFKWSPRTELVIDGTFNPDFSQLEIDEVALTRNNRFAIFKGEKRPLFLESRDLLQSPTEAIYTRSITDPKYALRATWRGDQTSGTAMLTQDRGGGLVLTPGAFFNGYASQPGHTSVLLRGLHNDLGAVLLHRQYENQIGANSVIGLDRSWNISDSLRSRVQLLGSSTSALPDAFGELTKHSPKNGLQLSTRWISNTKDFDQFYEFSHTTEHFRNDSGFTSQAGVTQLSTEFTRKYQEVGIGSKDSTGKPWITANILNFFLSSGYVRDTKTGQTVSAYLTPGFFFEGARGFELNGQLRALSLVRGDPTSPLLKERYAHFWTQMTPGAPLVLVSSELDIGRLADFNARVARPGLRWNVYARLRPLDRVEIEPRLDFARFKSDSGYALKEQSVRMLTLFHIAPGHVIRWISQTSRFDRQSEPQYGTSLERGSGNNQSLTYIWRESASNAIL